MNSTNSTSRSQGVLSKMMHGDCYEYMALARIVDTVRLTGNVAKFFECMDSTAIDAMQTEVFMQVFAGTLDSGLYAEKTAQTVVKMLCEFLNEYDNGAAEGEAMAFTWQSYRSIAKRFIQAWVADGWMLYTPEEELKDATIPAYYVINSAMLKRSIQHLLHDEAKVNYRFIQRGTKHAEGALAMSAHKFSVNLSRAKHCADWLNKGYYLNRKGEWTMAKTDCIADMDKLESQRQTLAQARIAYSTKPNGWHFEVKADFRGRLYYISGMLNPQAGGVAGYILGNDEEVTYDSTASFAQFISVVTGDRALADACNLLNYTSTAKDFYGNVYALASGKACPAKASFEREVAKQYLMPKAYGSSDEASRTRAINMAVEAGNDEAAAAGIVDVLTTYNGLNVVKNHASKAAEKAAEQDEQLSWVTPSGFVVTQNYWQTAQEVWKTGETENEFIPTKLTFKEPTGKVQVQKTDDDSRSAVVAAAANFIQSLDAAFMALVQAEYYTATGKTIVGVHDSFTLGDAADVPLFLDIAWKVFCTMAQSPELADMREVIGLPQKSLLWINPNRRPLFLDQE